jgi:hypothetical protein
MRWLWRDATDTTERELLTDPVASTGIERVR